jgi:CubicO group peptidase (beta-lactamase class C family)
MEQQAANLSFSGAALVARRGRVLLRKGYGAASRRWKRPNSERTQFRIASISKQFTAVAILLLQGRGKLDVHDHVCDYISDCPAAWADITLHQLLTHTSGIHNLYADPGYTAWQATPAAPAEVMQHYIELPLDFPPGTSWNYTNSGYDLLGQVIERASGLPYEKFLRENIFTPLGMRDTGLLGATHQASGYANSFDLTPADTSHPMVDYASGGLYSTVGDLYLWDQALFDDSFLPADLRDLAFTAYEFMPQSGGLSYGYGFMVGELPELNGHRLVGHTGRIEGFLTANFYFPDEQAAVILLANQRDPSLNSIFIQLASRVLEPAS